MEEVEAHIAYYQDLWKQWLIGDEEVRQHSGWYSSYHYE
jgi:hypothetical protein